MGYTSKFKGAEIDAILESCVFPSFFYDALMQVTVTKEVIDELWQYMREHNKTVIHDVRLGMNLEMEVSNEVVVTSDLRIVNNKLYTEVLIFVYDDGTVYHEDFVVKYPLAIEE